MNQEIVAAAMQEQAFKDAMGNGYDALKSNDALNEVHLNQKIMTPEWRSDKLYILKPKIEMKICWVPQTDKNGEAVLFEGEPVVEKKEVQFFDGWNNDEIDLPGGNIFKTDFNTAILSDTQINLANKLTNMYISIIELSIATGEDYSYDLYKFSGLLGSLLNTSKSRYGKTLELMKTQITKGEQTNTIRQMLLEDQRRKGVFGKIKGIFGR